MIFIIIEISLLFILYEPVPGTILDSLLTSNGFFLACLTNEIPVSFPTSKRSFLPDLVVEILFLFLSFNSASLISYSPTPGFPFVEVLNILIFPSI